MKWVKRYFMVVGALYVADNLRKLADMARCQHPPDEIQAVDWSWGTTYICSHCGKDMTDVTGPVSAP